MPVGAELLMVVRTGSIFPHRERDWQFICRYRPLWSGRSNLEFINLGMASDLGPLEASRLQRGPTGRHKSAQRRPIAQPELSVNLVKMNFYRSLGQIELLT